MVLRVVTQEKGVAFLQHMKLEELYQIIAKRKTNPTNDSYVSSLFKKGENAQLQKIGEEATELIIAAKSETKQRVIEESCDVLFHILVMLVANEISVEDIEKELERRRKK